MNEHDNGLDGSDLYGFSEEDIRALWQRACSEHLQPSRLFQLAMALTAPGAEDTRHLASCSQCRLVYDRYRADVKGNAHSRPASAAAPPSPEQTRAPGGDSAAEEVQLPSLSLFQGPERDTNVPAAPDLLCNSLRVEGPVLFPNGEVAFKTWQLGRLEQLSRTTPEIADPVIQTIVTRAYRLLLTRLARRKLVLVCFGRTIHRLGTRLGGRLFEQGFAHVHVVLAHDFYSPTLVCAPHELRDADVTVIVDVLHTGGLLDRLFAVCRKHHPACLRGLALIDQSAGKRLSAEVLALWSEGPEERITLEQFCRTATHEQQRQLTRFEPNTEYAVGFHADVPAPQVDVGGRQAVDYDSPFVEMIQRARALRCDYEIGGKRYPYAINILDLLRHAECRDRIVSMAEEELADLRAHKSCLAYHAGRGARAGRLAKVLGSALQWRVVKLGTGAASFAVTEHQCQQLAAFHNVVIVDAAIRTGDSLTAITQALQKSVPLGTHIVAFCVLDALSRISRHDLASSLRIDIRTLFEVPLAPPTERVRNWIRLQKTMLRESLSKSGLFSHLDDVLRSYCEHVKWPRNCNHRPSPDDAPTMLQQASCEARVPERAVDYIGTACEQGKVRLIRHVPVDQVVHDRSVQDLLLGVMYNSMNPSMKESAIFALGAARNYEWMTYEWLQCNRAFLGSRTNAWKSVLMVECQMKVEGMREPLSRFRDALGQFATKLPPARRLIPSPDGLQGLFSCCAEDGSPADVIHEKPARRKREERLRERVQLLLDVTR